MKLNNKGFLITGILYSLLLLFLVLIVGMVAIMNARQKKIDYISKDIITKLNDKYDFNIAKVWEFGYTGNYQTFTVPADGYYKIELWGAQGGTYSETIKGDKGAYTKGIIYLTKGENIYVYVGLSPKQGENSFNGGGNPANKYGYGGGGATDIRLTSGNWNNFDSLKSRIMVAAGGGGYGNGHTSQISAGGFGGAFYGGNSGITSAEQGYVDLGYTLSPVSIGATQTSGGVPGRWYTSVGGKNGEFGIGAEGVNGVKNNIGEDIAACSNGGCSSGAGGGGYYGGASGPQKVTTDSAFSGSGGSSFVSGLYGCDAITESSTSDAIVHTGQPNHYSGKLFYNGMMIAGDSSMPTHDGLSTMIGNSGNGYAKISLMAKSPTGYKIVNLVENGSYEEELENWKPRIMSQTMEIYESKSYIGNNSIKSTSLADNVSIGTVYYTGFDTQLNHIYYTSVYIANPYSHGITVRNGYKSATDSSGTTIFGAYITHSASSISNSNSFKKLSIYYPFKKTTADFNNGIATSYVSIWNLAAEQMKDESFYVDGVITVDLTETFGAGNEPTKEWCDENISYFDGEITIYK